MALTWDARRTSCPLPNVSQGKPLVAGTPGVEIVNKHHYSAFFSTDLEIVLRVYGIETLLISGVTTECCCHATARDAMYRDHRVGFLSDATGDFGYPDLGAGGVSADEVQRATPSVLAGSTARMLTVAEMTAG